jgi:hypothetical protein
MLDVVVVWTGGADERVLGLAQLRAGDGITVGDAEGSAIVVPTAEAPSGLRVVVRCRAGRVDVSLGAFAVRAVFGAAHARARRALRPRVDASAAAAIAASLLLHVAGLALLAWRSAAPGATRQADAEAAAVRSALQAALDARHRPVVRAEVAVERHGAPSSAEPSAAASKPSAKSPAEPNAKSPAEPNAAMASAESSAKTPAEPSAKSRSISPPIDLLKPISIERIQQQIASWDPVLVKGPRIIHPWSQPSDAPDRRIPARVVADVIRVNMGRLLVCHGAGLPGSLDAAGEVRVQFVIEPHGNVVEASDVGGTFADEAVRRCIVQAFTKLTFPPHPLGYEQTVLYPVVLAPQDVGGRERSER